MTSTGRHVLDDMITGREPVPAAAARLGLPAPSTWEPGRVAAQVEFRPDQVLPGGAVFGGYLACLVDHVAGLAMLSVLPRGTSFVTATLEISYQAPVRAGAAGLEATVRRRGSRWAVVNVAIRQEWRQACVAVVEQVVLPAARSAPAGPTGRVSAAR